MDERYQKVFKPGTYPELTYVVRQSVETKYTYEERLQQSLKIDGYLTYIIGPSKTGKTVPVSYTHLSSARSAGQAKPWRFPWP